VNTSDLANDFLLQQGRIYLPRDFDSPLCETIDAYISYYRQNHATEPIKLFCRTDGGDAEEGLAIANVVKLDGNIHGYLIGMTMNAGATVWSACSKRYVYPNSRIGIHPCTWKLDGMRLTAAKMKSMWQDFLGIDEASCQFYADASNKDFAWWWKFYNEPGDIKWLNATELVAMEMAELILPQSKGGNDDNDNSPYPAS